MNKEKSEKSADICTSRCRSDHVLPFCYHFSPCFQLNLSSHLASPGQWQVAMQNTTRPSKILSTGRLVTSSFKSSPASLESSFKDPFWAKIGNKIWTKIRNWKQNLKKKTEKKTSKMKKSSPDLTDFTWHLAFPVSQAYQSPHGDEGSNLQRLWVWECPKSPTKSSSSPHQNGTDRPLIQKLGMVAQFKRQGLVTKYPYLVAHPSWRIGEKTLAVNELGKICSLISAVYYSQITRFLCLWKILVAIVASFFSLTSRNSPAKVYSEMAISTALHFLHFPIFPCHLQLHPS